MLRPHRRGLWAGGCAVVIFGLGPTAAVSSPPLFADRTTAAGVDFAHFNGMSGELYFPEMMGSGCGVLDADGDGRLDLFFAQGRMLGRGKTAAEAILPVPESLSDRLLLNRPSGDGESVRFVDAGERFPAGKGYPMGVAAGDFDNDGHVDLFVASFGPDRFLRNRGDGTFEDVTPEAARKDPGWSTSASFADLDSDGWLDLVVARYVHFDLERNPRCYAPDSRRDYCGPSAFTPQSDRIWRNRGDGTFEDATARLLPPHSAAAGLGVVVADFDGDGRPDIFVANDQMENHLWMQQEDGTFHNQAALAGVAVNREGRPEASMGVAAADYDDSGTLDLLVTHLDGETNTLYVNAGDALFEDRSIESGLGPPSLPFTGFGTGWLDADGDGDLDLLTVNGAVKIQRELATGGDPFPLGQRNQLFENLGRGRFREMEGFAGPASATSEVSRAAAIGDLDDDGDTDFVVCNTGGPARVLLNRGADDRRWIGVRALLNAAGDGAGGAEGGRQIWHDALGARVTLVRSDGTDLHRWIRTDGSYAAASDPRVLFGLGAREQVSEVRVTWPDGTVEAWKDLPVNAYSTLRRGAGKPLR